MCSCCCGYQREKTFRWNSSYLHAGVLLNAYHGLWRLLKGWMWPLPYRKATCVIHFDAFGVSSSMNLVGTMSSACLDHVPALSLTHSINTFLCGRWWRWRFASRYRPPTFHVQAWYDEVRDFSFSYPQECNPYCPFKCSGPVCTHYTQVTNPGLYHLIMGRRGGQMWLFFFNVSLLQLVWATSSRIGCAVNLCYNMNVWGQIWAKAVYLVCNYSPK